MKNGFDNDKYLKIQSEEIRKRFKKFDKLYLEVGGKLFDDTHAARVLPGFKKDSKINMFLELKNDLEIIFCVNAKNIEKNKIRSENNLTYDMETIRLINLSRSLGFTVNSIVITLYDNQPIVDKFIKKLNRQGIKTYLHKNIDGYPYNEKKILSDEGFGINEYVKTTKPLILVNAPGPGSGKLATCLSQLYNEHKNGINAGYAKFETFPVWNLSLMHPVNVAYEAATADLGDINMIDSFHLEEYGIGAVNYNRDLEIFPVLKNILNTISGKNIYKSPTDMGVNMIGFCIKDDEKVSLSSKKEIVRRYYQEKFNYKIGAVDEEVPLRVKKLMTSLNIDESILEVVKPALIKSKQEHKPVIAIKLKKGVIVTGKQTDLLSAASSMILNSIKVLKKIPDDVNLLSPSILEPILKYRNNYKSSGSVLDLQETLIALSICSATNPLIEAVIDYLKNLDGLNAHSSHIIDADELKTLKKLGINITCEDIYYSSNLY